jgi:5-methylcytosine-specific restriction endonuclease McrA
MARLTSLAPRIGSLPSRLGVLPPKDEAERSQRRDQSAPWRKWYKTKEWRELRAAVLLRDNYVCQKTGVLLIGKYPADNSPVADHRKPHRGDRALFFDPDNVEAVSKGYHDKQKQKEEQASLHHRGVWD